MDVAADVITELRSMVDEPSDATWSDDDLETIILKYPLVDPLGTKPFDWLSGSPPTKDWNENTWVPTWDLHAAARDVWERKASEYAEDYKMRADGADLSRDQVYEHMLNMARYHGSRRTVRSRSPRPGQTVGSQSSTATA